ncbi:MAG: DUF72 domain-containing protein [candidate division Zixibacteria bacterium]|nr:DUF72 domain-containing protein [candidate division Zixibacteria bacterium]
MNIHNALFVLVNMEDIRTHVVRIGTSGFSYKDWLGNFYPQFCPAKDFLRFYACVFATVEIDSTFYRIPTEKTVAGWYKTTPEHFVFTAKFPRTVTHEGTTAMRLANAEQFVNAMKPLEEKLGPLLLQFPYSFKPSEHGTLLRDLVADLPGDVRIALEVRNRKWLTDEFYGLLKSRNIALCLVDHPWMPRESALTADFLYIRLLGDRKKIDNDFSYIRNDRIGDLQWWTKLVEEFSRERGEVYAYINNHYSGHSPTTARHLIDMLQS